MEVELSASLYEAEYVAVAGVGTSANPEAFSDQETPTKPDSPSSGVADPEGVPVTVSSSSEWEAVTKPNAMFWIVALAAREARDGVAVPGGTYSGSCSLLEPMTKRADRVTYFERPRT